MATVGEYLTNVTMRGVDDGVGLENTVNSFQVTPREGLLELRAGNPGGPGPEGPAAYPWKWRGDIVDRAALDALRPTLNIAHRGFAYRLVSENSVMYWDGESFYPFVNAFGAEGPQGPATSISVGTVTTLAQGASATAEVSGAAPNQVLNLGIPRGGPGVKGDPGGPGPIRTAPDYDDTVAPVQDSVPAWDAATSKWRPMPYPAWRGPWTIGESAFSAASNSSAASVTVATISIPAQPFAWRPFITGGVQGYPNGSDVTQRIDAEVRVGSATGQVVAVGRGIALRMSTECNIRPYFGTASQTPDSTTGVIAANATTTFYVVLVRQGSTSTWSYFNNLAGLSVWAMPVYAP